MSFRLVVVFKTFIISLVTGGILLFQQDCQAAPKKLLVFHKNSSGWFKHDSQVDGIAMYKQMGIDRGFAVDASDDSTLFTDAKLAQYDAIVFLATGGDFFSDAQKLAFQKFIRSGKGWIGVHSADNCLNNWGWFHEMIGSEYRGDAWKDGLPLYRVDKTNPSTKDLTEPWLVKDQYRKNTWKFNDTTLGSNVILKVDPNHYKNNIGTATSAWSNQLFVPYVYTRSFEGGRVWYGGMGHASETYKDPKWIKIFAWGVDYALGNLQPTRINLKTKSLPLSKGIAREVYTVKGIKINFVRKPTQEIPAAVTSRVYR